MIGPLSFCYRIDGKYAANAGLEPRPFAFWANALLTEPAKLLHIIRQTGHPIFPATM